MVLWASKSLQENGYRNSKKQGMVFYYTLFDLTNKNIENLIKLLAHLPFLTN
jgi:hypothetical protein